MSNIVLLTTSGGISNSVVGNTSTLGIQSVYTGPLPIQIAGLVPLTPCDNNDCRDSQQQQCYLIPAFGDNLDRNTPRYTNDSNAFLIDTSPLVGYTAQFAIQKQTNWYLPTQGPPQWQTVATISNNQYGIYQPLGTISGHPTYMAFNVNWGLVINSFGIGIYRIVVNTGRPVFSGTQATAYIPAPSTTNLGGDQTVFLSIKCGGTIYTIPSFIIPNGATFAQQLAIIAAAFTAYFTSNNLPFTAIVQSNIVIVSGTQGAAQNGCVVTYRYVTTGLRGGGKETMEGGSGGNTISYNCALQSYPFLVKPWNCQLAHGTTKFEIVNGGMLGKIGVPGMQNDLTGLTWYDSVRTKNSFFGETEFNYDELLIEYGEGTTPVLGTMERVRDKVIPGYKWSSGDLPMWQHYTLAVYMMMADQVFVSDYNLNNSDYTIQRRQVIKKGAYKPNYLDKEKFDASMRFRNRTGKVTVEFVDGIQWLLKSNC